MRIAFSLAVVAAAILYQQSSAAMQRGAYTQYGNYKVSCGTLTSSSGLQKGAYTAWIMGFVSGAGYGYSISGTTLAETDYEGGAAWIEKYCSEHPLDEIVNAAIALVKELAARRR
jgi:hypothetical protein